MAFARAPKRPKRPTAPKAHAYPRTGLGGPTATVGKPTVLPRKPRRPVQPKPRPAAPKPAPVGATPATPAVPKMPPTVAPQPVVTPAPTTLAPPQLPTSASGAIDAQEGYAIDMPEVNRALFEAAFRYGGAPKVTQYGLDPTGKDTQYDTPVADNPNSALSSILRNQQTTERQTGEAHNARGTYFSGLQQRDLANVGDEANRQRQAQLESYNSALSSLATRILRSRLARDSALRGGLAADLQAALENPPSPAPEETGGGSGGPGSPLPPHALVPGTNKLNWYIPGGNTANAATPIRDPSLKPTATVGKAKVLPKKKRKK